MTEQFHCPECGSKEVFSTHEQAFMVNTGDHYCHMVKPQDSDSKAGCIECNWRGERIQLARMTEAALRAKNGGGE